MVLSAVFITDLKGKDKDDSEQRPVFTEDGYTFVYLKHNNLYLMTVFRDYFGELEEESIRDNFVIIFELLDETMDHGYPQTTEARILREYITQEGHRLEAAPRPPTALTNAVSWRSEGIKHRKNEIFLDVVEKLNLLVSSNGTVLHSEIIGAVKMKSFLSGMPELKLGLNDKALFEATGRSSSKGKAVEMEDIKFHQCVRLARFESDRTISFIPPDGEFDLMTYRLATHVKPLIWVEAVVEPHSRSRIEYMVKAKSQFKSRSIANTVEIVIPVPPDVDSPSFKCSIGSVTYVPDRDAIVWSIKQFNGSREYLMRAHFGLPSVDNHEATDDWKAPIQVKTATTSYACPRAGIQQSAQGRHEHGVTNERQDGNHSMLVCVELGGSRPGRLLGIASDPYRGRVNLNTCARHASVCLPSSVVGGIGVGGMSPRGPTSSG
ncbi:AP-1 complex subunit mu-1 [Phytophthora fragariae]|uniref:AP-1 complex subunit mu-1 n=1 Tax=Phytophthora fragariae TaxID=53985 RepID=A0A6A3HH37_9STRA|nr:AP-1 complex subunit mu-1 [Phytophthora fragariae]